MFDRAIFQGRSPLVHATSKGQGKVVKVLLEFGARTESVDKYGWTPLQIASSKGDCTSARHLIGARADIKSSDPKDRQTPLHIAARMQMLPIVTMLLEHGGIPLSLPDVPPFIST